MTVRKEKIYSYCLLIKIIEAKLSFQREACLGKKFSFIYSENCKMFKNKITEKKGQDIKSDMEKSLFVVHYCVLAQTPIFFLLVIHKPLPYNPVLQVHQ